jgi:hypothetical protein
MGKVVALQSKLKGTNDMEGLQMMPKDFQTQKIYSKSKKRYIYIQELFFIPRVFFENTYNLKQGINFKAVAVLCVV